MFSENFWKPNKNIEKMDFFSNIFVQIFYPFHSKSKEINFEYCFKLTNLLFLLKSI